MLRELRALIAACLADQSVSRADLDVMLCLAEADPEALPPRALALLHEADIQFHRHPADRLSHIGRLARMLAAAQDLHLRATTRALTPQFEMSAAMRAHALGLCADLRQHVETAAWLDVMNRRRLLDRIAACETEITRDSGAFDVLRGGASDVDEILAQLQHDDAELRHRFESLVALARKAIFGEPKGTVLTTIPMLRQVLA